MDTIDDENTPDDAAALEQRIEAYVAAYRSQILDEAQAAVALPALKALVLACRPRTVHDARVMLASACRFYADVAPVGVGIEGLFTEAAVDTWSNLQKANGLDSRSLTNHVGRLRRFARLQAGLPARIRVESRTAVLPPPLLADSLSRIAAACRDTSTPALRGLTAAVGAGLVGAAAVGIEIVPSARFGLVVSAPGRIIPVAATVAGMASDGCGVVLDGDWEALRSVANRARIWFGPDVARQTHRYLLATAGLSVQSLMQTYAMSKDSLDAILPYLAPPSSPDDSGLVAMLRG